VAPVRRPVEAVGGSDRDDRVEESVETIDDRRQPGDVSGGDVAPSPREEGSALFFFFRGGIAPPDALILSRDCDSRHAELAFRAWIGVNPLHHGFVNHRQKERTR
jgi:hypothetical protein